MCTRLALLLALAFASVASAAQDREVLVDPCTDVSSWSLNPGAEFPGADGQVARGADQQRGACLRLDYDFTGGGNYVTASRALDIPAASAVSFWVRQDGGNSGFIRICDATDQEHAGGFRIQGAGWQKITMPLDQKTFGGHWHGKNDGQWYFPLKTIIIGVSHGATARGTLYLGDLAFDTSDARLFYAVDMRAADPGNIAFLSPRGIPVSVSLFNRLDEPGDLTLRVTSEDWYGQKAKLLETRLACKPRSTTARRASLDGKRANYYLLTAEVLRDGKVVAQSHDAVVVTPRPRNFGVDDPKSFFALQHTTDGARAERLGVKWVRSGRDWRWGEMNQGRYVVGDLDPIRRNHQLIMYTMSAYPPQWAQKGTDEKTFWESPEAEQHLDWWARYVEHSCRTLADQVDTFEIQNEPDLTCMWQVGLQFDAGVERYLKILRVGAAAIRRGAPHANVAGIDVSGGDYDGGLKFSDAVMAKGGNLIDIYTGHPYAGVRYFGSAPGGGDLQPMWPVKNEERRKCLDTLAMIRRYGGKQRFWIGEKGWGLDVNAGPLSQYSRDFACCLVQSMVIAHSVPGVERYFWFLEEGCNEGGHEYGLFRRGKPLPAALAYATLAYLLYHAQPFRSPEIGQFLQAHCFVSEETGDGTLVLWSEGEKARLAVERMPAKWSLLDLMGGRVTGGDKGHALALALDRTPVYLRFPASAAPAVCDALARGTVSVAEPLKLEAAYLGQTDRLSARIRNITLQPQTGTIEALGQKHPVSLKPGECRVVELPLPTPPRGDREGLPVRLTVGRATLTARARTDFTPLQRVSGWKTGDDLAYWEPRPSLVLNERSQVYPPDPGIGWDGPEDLSATVWLGWDEGLLYVIARVRDDIHHVDSDEVGGFWNSDSLQIGLDPLHDAAGGGYDADDLEVGLVLGPHGPRAWETVPSARPLDAPFSVARRDGDTIYQVGLPWALLKIAPTPGTVFGLNLIINENDGAGRAYWMGLTPGIGEAKRPEVFRSFVLR